MKGVCKVAGAGGCEATRLVECDDRDEGDNEPREEDGDEHARAEEPPADVEVRLHEVRELRAGVDVRRYFSALVEYRQTDSQRLL